MSHKNKLIASKISKKTVMVKTGNIGEEGQVTNRHCVDTKDILERHRKQSVRIVGMNENNTMSKLSRS